MVVARPKGVSRDRPEKIVGPCAKGNFPCPVQLYTYLYTYFYSIVKDSSADLGHTVICYFTILKHRKKGPL